MCAQDRYTHLFSGKCPQVAIEGNFVVLLEVVAMVAIFTDPSSSEVIGGGKKMMNRLFYRSNVCSTEGTYGLKESPIYQRKDGAD